MRKAGLGGGTGGGVLPTFARAEPNAGAVTVAAVAMPFDIEGPRNETVEPAFSHLERGAWLCSSRFKNLVTLRLVSPR